MLINSAIKEKMLVAAGLFFVLSGILCNEWTLAALFSSDGTLADDHRIVIWVADLFALGIGLIVLLFRKFLTNENLLAMLGLLLIAGGLLLNDRFITVLLALKMNDVQKLIVWILDFSSVATGATLILHRYREIIPWKKDAILFMTDRIRPRYHILIIFAVGLTACLPILILGFPSTHSTAMNLSHVMGFSQQLWNGEIYPRWISRMNDGLGSPVFFYYGPVTFYLSSFLDIFIPGDPLKWHTLAISMAFILVLSGMASYVWFRRIAGSQAAVIAAVVYMILPYHFETDLLKRGSLCEFTSYIWFPLILYCIHHIGEGKRIYIGYLSLLYCLLIATHAPTTLLFSPFALAYGAFIALERKQLKTFLSVIVGFAAGIGLASIYLIPAMLTQHYIHPESWWTGFFKYDQWFFLDRDHWRPNETIWHFMFRLQHVTVLILIMAAFLLFSVHRRVEKNQRGQLYFWFGALCFAILLMTGISIPIWQTIPLLQKVQFPFRLNTVVDVSISTLLAIWCSYYARYRHDFRLKVVSVGTSVLVVYFVATGAWEVRGNVLPSHTETAFISTLVSKGVDSTEYRPHWVRSDISLSNCLVRRYLENMAEDKLPSGCRYPSERASIMGGTGTVAVIKWEPRIIELQTDSKDGMSFLVRQLYYPAWHARIEGQSSHISIEPSPDIGLMTVSVPEGSHKVLLTVERLPQEKLGQGISGIFLLGILLFLAYEKAYEKRRQKESKT